ncbi:lysophospholipid acyltransferase family protein [Georgenia yuyongxinii]
MKATLGSILRVFYQPWIRGAERIPSSGPVILASNHLAVIDSFFLPLMISREVVFLGKQDYFTGTGLKGRFVAAFMRGVGTIPVDRSGGKASEAALQTGLRRLREGGLFGIYPEGTRSPDGRLYRGKTGVARLALESGAPVVPVAMIGTNIAQPIGKRIPKLHRIGAVVGEPLDFSRYRGLENDRFVLRSITDEIMYELMRLSGQEYVDMYAATMKTRLAAAKKEQGRKHPDAVAEAAAAAPIGAPGGRPVPEVVVPEPSEDEIRAAAEVLGEADAAGAVEPAGGIGKAGRADPAGLTGTADPAAGTTGEPGTAGQVTMTGDTDTARA